MSAHVNFNPPGSPAVRPADFEYREVDGARMFQIAIPAGARVPVHRHGPPHFCLMVQGDLIDDDESGATSLGTGQLRQSPRNDGHRVAAGPDGATCFVVVGPDRGYAGPTRRLYTEGDRQRDLAVELHGLFRAGDAFISHRVKLILMEFFAGGHRQSRPRASAIAPDWLAEARQWIDDHFDEAPSLAGVARAAGVHRVHLARTFRAHFGCSVGDYVRLAQISAARDLILGTRRPLAEIAAATGHADQSHLTRRCGALFGITPAGMRAANRSTGRPEPGAS